MTSMWKKAIEKLNHMLNNNKKVFGRGRIHCNPIDPITYIRKIYLWKKWIAEKHIRGWNNRLMVDKINIYDSICREKKSYLHFLDHFYCKLL